LIKECLLFDDDGGGGGVDPALVLIAEAFIAAIRSAIDSLGVMLLLLLSL
jgi:hypothetical protein